VPLLNRKQQLFGQVEDIESTAETLTAADAILALEVDTTPNKAMIARDAVSTSLSREKDVLGRTSTSFSFGMDLIGGGALTTQPPMGDFLRSCGLQERSGTTNGVTYIQTGASGVTTAIVAGDTLTGGTSGATAMALFNMTAAGTASTKVFVRNVSGTFSAAEAVTTGGNSRFTTHASTAQAITGYRYTPDSNHYMKFTTSAESGTPLAGVTFLGATSGCQFVYASGTHASEGYVLGSHVAGTPKTVTASEVFNQVHATTAATFTAHGTPAQVQNRTPSMTLQHNKDGYGRQSTGCRGNAVFALTTSDTARVNFSFEGVNNSDGASALLTGITYPTTALNRFAGGFLGVNGQRFPVSAVSFDLGNEVSMRADPNAATGDDCAVITGRDIQITLDPEMVSASSFDWLLKWGATTTFTVHATVGTAEGNQIAIFAPVAQVMSFSDSDRDGLWTGDITAKCARSDEDGDDELEVYVC
jgi:hypothetical protein